MFTVHRYKGYDLDYTAYKIYVTPGMYLIKCVMMLFFFSVLVELQRIPYTKMLGIAHLLQCHLVQMKINHLLFHPEITEDFQQASRIHPSLTGQYMWPRRDHLLDMMDTPVSLEEDGMMITMLNNFANSPDVFQNNNICPSQWPTKPQRLPFSLPSLTNSSMWRLWKPPPPMDPPLPRNTSFPHADCPLDSSQPPPTVLLVFPHSLLQNTCHLHPVRKFHRKRKGCQGRSITPSQNHTLLQNLRRGLG